MNILGIGGWELVAILVIALVVAGPKRMLQWAYIMGTYVAKLRMMWAEAMTMIQKELDAAGVDIQLPKEPPTRQKLNQLANKALAPLTSPIKESLAEVDSDLKRVKEAANPTPTNGRNSVPNESEQKPDSSDQSFGTWSNTGNKEE